MNIQQGRTLQETTTTLAPAEVLAAAKQFFARRNRLYAAFIEQEGPTFVTMRGQGGEEIAIGAVPASDGRGTIVTGSTYLYDQQVGQFLAMLPPTGQVVTEATEAGAAAPGAA